MFNPTTLYMCSRLDNSSANTYRENVFLTPKVSYYYLLWQTQCTRDVFNIFCRAQTIIRKHGQLNFLLRWKSYFVTKNGLTYCEKKLFQWSRKFFEIRGWRPRICQNFEITWTICSKSERSKQFLETECFFNLFLEVSDI